jgi:hypothetical protein
MFAGGIVGDVVKLGCEVGVIADAVFVIAGVPDLAQRLLPGGEGLATLDELDAAGGALVDRWCDEGVDVIGHHGEAMELEVFGVSIAEESGDEEFSVRGALEVAMALKGEDSDGVGTLRLSDGGHGGEHIPGAKAQL